MQPVGRIVWVGWSRRADRRTSALSVPALAADTAGQDLKPGWTPVAEPLVTVSVWGGAHDGDRFLIARRKVQEGGQLRYLGAGYAFCHDDHAGWRVLPVPGDH